MSLLETLEYPEFSLPRWHNLEDAVVHTVIAQMLSKGAAQAILAKLYGAHGDSASILKWAERSARRRGAIYGVSQNKRKALQEWQRHTQRNGNGSPSWSKLSTADLHNHISSLWGFGQWSADMLAIFYLGRKDVWPTTDTGIANMSALVFRTTNTKNIQEHIAGNETFIALCFWKAIDRRLVPALRQEWER